MKQTKSRILSAVLKHLKSSPDFESTGIGQYRKLLEKSANAFKQDKAINAKATRIGSIDAVWLTPEKYNRNRLLLFTHGGGYIAGSIRSHKDLASRVAAACEAKVLLYNYRLAPEHPFPQGFEDVKKVYHWLSNLYGRTHTISLIGDSAGAGLTLSLLSTLLSEGRPLPACLVLISPWIDLACKNSSHIENKDIDPMLSLSVLKKTARLYAKSDLSNPLISPINNEFSGAPPVLIQTGENEILIDDSKILAQKLQQAGSSVHLEIWKDMFHVWHYFAKYLSEGRHAIQKIGKFIRTHT